MAAPPMVMWSPPRVVALSSQYVFGGATVAVSRDGHGVVAWATTPKRPVFCFGCTKPKPPDKVPGGSVLAVIGGLRSGFSRPITIARYRRDGPIVASTAVSGSGAVFVVWSREASGPTLIARVSRHGASRPRMLLPRRAYLYPLTSGLDGPILVSWLLPQDGGEAVYDAPLLGSGRHGQTRRLAFVPRSGRMPELAFNDRGAILVAWQDLGSLRQNVPFPVKVVFCPPAGRCGPTRTVRLGPSAPHQNGFMAAALTDQNTVVIACDAQIEGRGASTDAGVWATVSRNGGPFSPEQRISATGNGPSLAAFGQDSVVLSYTPPRSAPAAAWSAPAIATLAPGQQRFRPAGQYPGTSTGDVPFVLSGGGSNTFAVDWGTTGGHRDIARIAVGGPGGIGTPHRVGDTIFPSIALDHRGDTLVAWSHARKVSLEVALTR